MTKTDSGYGSVETALGWLGLGWSRERLCAVSLPEPTREACLRSLRRRLPHLAECPLPAALTPLVERLRAYAAGSQDDFTDVAVEFGARDAFALDVYRAARTLAYGQTTTYGGLADLAGHPGKAQAVGQTLGANPVPIVVPCHRIVAAGGRMGGFSGAGGVVTKRRLLDLEQATMPSPAGQASFGF
jgi:methylated-DNA-[protein]-cysteine S-methyltransferase